MATLQDFSLVNAYVKQMQKDFKIQTLSKAFLYLGLDLLLNLQQDEIEESITEGGMDRGIDALYIDDSSSVANIHIFNFKYTDKFKHVKKNFPSNEVDKILSIIKQILNKDDKLKKQINPSLYEKIKDIWNIFDSQNPNFIVYLCSNFENNLTSVEEERFEKTIDAEYKNFSIKYFNINNFVNMLTNKGRVKIDGEMKVIDKNYFAKIDGNIRALVANIDTEELLKLVTNNFKSDVIEDIFNDNIRIFLQYRSRINKNIKETALCDDNYKFFYFNNGLTLVCDKFEYEERRSPIVKLSNIQIVNGGQTIHALYDAYSENKEAVKNINILVRIYETTASDLPQDIAEYTNSQNPVKNRDIRANDYIQKKLEKELLTHGYFYERKKGFYKNKPRSKRLDSEKIGQILMAFYNDMPGDAKNKKRLIFEDKFEDIFNEELTAEKILFIYRIYKKIEERRAKEQKKMNLLKDEAKIEKKNHILYATYYILYLLKKLSLSEKIPLDPISEKKIFALYTKSLKLIKKFIKNERKTNAKYTHSYFFKGNRLKKLIDDYFKS